MWITQEPKKVALRNKRHFEEKNGECTACLKYSVLIVVEKKYIKCNIWRVAVRPSYIQDAQFLKVNGRKPYWMGHVLGTNCLLNHVVEGRTERGIEVTQRRGRRLKQLLDGFKGTRGYCKLKEALDSAVWRSGCGRSTRFRCVEIWLWKKH